MSEWKESNLNEIADIIMGQSPSGDSCNNSGIGTPLLNGPTEFGSHHPKPVQFTTDPKKKSKPNDLLFCVRGSTTGKMNWSNSEYAIGRGIAAIRHKLGTEYRYFIKALIDYNLDYLLRTATGSTFPNVSKDSLYYLKVKVPSLETQADIAEILSSLDDKIELNNKINKELETLAQLLFKQWFIEFEFPNENGEPYKSSGGEMIDSELGEIPKGWQVGSIYDISSVIYGAPFKSSLFNQENIGFPLIRIRDLKTFKPQNWTEEVHPKGTKIYPGDLIVGMDAEFRPHFWLGQEGWLNQRVCLFKPKDKFARLFVRETIRPRLEFYENSSVGTTVIHLGKGDIDTFKSLLPKSSISKLFTELTEPLIDKIILNSQESETLRKTRDYILPKLISGELQINDN